MGVHIADNKLAIIPKIIYYNLFRNIHNNLKYKADSIIKHDKFLAKRPIKIKVDY